MMKYVERQDFYLSSEMDDFPSVFLSIKEGKFERNDLERETGAVTRSATDSLQRREKPCESCRRDLKGIHASHNGNTLACCLVTVARNPTLGAHTQRYKMG